MSVEALVVTTTARPQVARIIADHLLNERLAACVQASEVFSSYVWKGEVQRQPEVLLTIKTRRQLYARVESAIRAVHDYETPEILATLVVEGSDDYLRWIDEVTGGSE